MAKLTDTQTILLSSAAQRADGSLLPPPATLGAVTARIHKAVGALIKRGHAAEITVTTADRSWRSEADRYVGAMITEEGCAAIGVELAAAPSGGAEPIAQPAAPTPSTSPVPSTKAALVLSLLEREQGATLAELVAATGWLPHTTRAALTGIRKKGRDLAKGKRGDVTCYTLAA